MLAPSATREAIIAEIRRLAELHGRAPGIEIFTRESGIARHHWLGVYWSKWSDALIDAGYASNELNARLDSLTLLRCVADASIKAGKVPPKAEMKLLRRSDPTFPHDETLRKHFGDRAGLIAELRKLASTDASYTHLIAILPPVTQIASKSAAVVDGWVYLLKSGLHYKIGRSDAIERRIKEVALALPEHVSLIHAIQTDDPPGIEAYWHRRFSDRRQNGEWFKLEPNDLRAFRRRKFQ